MSYKTSFNSISTSVFQDNGHLSSKITDFNIDNYKYNGPSNIKYKHNRLCQQIRWFKMKSVLFKCNWHMLDTLVM